MDRVCHGLSLQWAELFRHPRGWLIFTHTHIAYIYLLEICLTATNRSASTWPVAPSTDKKVMKSNIFMFIQRKMPSVLIQVQLSTKNTPATTYTPVINAKIFLKRLFQDPSTLEVLAWPVCHLLAMNRTR